MKSRAIALLSVLALLGAACGPADDAAAPDDPAAPDDGAAPAEAYDVTLIQGVRGDEFYISMECGAREAAQELGVNLDVQGGQEWDPAVQTPVVNAVIASAPDAILIAPNDVTAMIPPLQEVVDAGIALITVDTTIDADLALSEIASDNIEGGREAARALAELLEGQDGKVMVVNVIPGISTTDQRQQGFEEEIANHDNLEYIGTEFSDNDPARAASIVSATLAAEPDLIGIFATNIFSAEGSATGLRGAGEAGEPVRIVGFDAGPAQVEQLNEGLVQALVAQRPGDIGYQGVQQAVAALTGEPVEAEITTGFHIVTQENLDTPESQDALYKASC